MKIREEDIKRAAFVDAISINRISGDSRGKVPWTGDISPPKTTVVFSWAGSVKGVPAHGGAVK